MSVRCWHVVLEWTKIMISEYWMWATWLTKVILYLSVAFVVGGAFCYFLLRQYLELKEGARFKIVESVQFVRGKPSTVIVKGICIHSFP